MYLIAPPYTQCGLLWLALPSCPHLSVLLARRPEEDGAGMDPSHGPCSGVGEARLEPAVVLASASFPLSAPPAGWRSCESRSELQTERSLSRAEECAGVGWGGMGRGKLLHIGFPRLNLGYEPPQP